MSARSVQLGDLIDISKGKKALQVFERPTKNSRRYLQIDDLRPDAKPKFVEPFNCPEASKSDVVIAWDGANAGTVSCNLDGYIGSTLAVLRPTNGKIFAPYLARFLEGNFSLLQAQSTGATVPHLDREVLEQLEIPLPDLPEQKRIAALLEQADRLRRTRRYTLELSDTVLPAVFLKFFGGWQSAAKKYPVKYLEEVVQQDRGVTYGIVQAGPHVPDGIPYIKTGDIIDGVIHADGLSRTSREIASSYRRSEVKFGDLVMSIRAKTLRIRMGSLRSCSK